MGGVKKTSPQRHQDTTAHKGRLSAPLCPGAFVARRLRLILIAGFLVICGEAPGGGSATQVWIPDNRDGTYTNPIIFADYSDPDVVRVGDDFYMTASSFNCSPGLPILHSRDLVNWTIIGHALQRQVPERVFDKPQHGNGVWAPAIRHHNGEFYVYYPDPDFGIYVVKAKNPAGPWSKPILIKSAKGWIDPCPFWDDDGNVYLVHAWAKSRAGINSILTLNRLTRDGMKVIDEGKTVFDGRANHPTIEGPKLYKRNGYYYIFAPAGGVAAGWQTVLRSKSIYGPYEDRIVMDKGKTEINGPHQGAWVELKSGESWFIHFQDRGAYGRITHLQPMKWIADWPVIGVDNYGAGRGEPILKHRKPNVGRDYPSAVPQTSDEFDSKLSGLQWQWQANAQTGWMSLAARTGWLRLMAEPMLENAANLWAAPNLLLQKLPAPEFKVTTRIDFGKLGTNQKAGLIVMGTDYSYVAVERDAVGVRVARYICGKAPEGNLETLEAEATLPGTTAFLRVKVSSGALCQFSFSSDGQTFVAIGNRFNAREGRWIGAKVGLFCLGDGAMTKGYADFDWFRFEL